MRIITYNLLDRKIIDDWNSLWNSSPNATPFNSPGWAISAIKVLKPKGQKVVAIYKDDNLVAVICLIKDRIYGIETYVEPMRCFAHRSGILADFEDMETIKALCSGLNGLGNVVLSHLSDRQIKKISRFCEFNILETTVSPCLHLNKDQTGELILKGKGKILRKAKKEEKHLSVKYCKKDLYKALESAFEIDDNSTKQEYGYSVFHSDSVKGFFVNLANYIRGSIRVNILYHRGVASAYEVGFVSGREYIDSERAYRSGHGWFTPGKALVVKLAEKLAGEGYSILDLGPGDDDFKDSLATDKREFHSIILGSSSIVGFYLRFCFVVRKRVYDIIFRNKKIYSLYRKTWLLYKEA